MTDQRRRDEGNLVLPLLLRTYHDTLRPFGGDGDRNTFVFYSLDKRLNMVLTKQGQPGKELTPDQVKAHVERILRGHGALIYTSHVKERMQQREFTTQDIQHVLETGTYTKGHWEPRERNHETNVSGWDLDGEELELSLALDVRRNRLIVVTGKRADQ